MDDTGDSGLIGLQSKTLLHALKLFRPETFPAPAVVAATAAGKNHPRNPAGRLAVRGGCRGAHVLEQRPPLILTIFHGGLDFPPDHQKKLYKFRTSGVYELKS
jgi:hypothetical protein